MSKYIQIIKTFTSEQESLVNPHWRRRCRPTVRGTNSIAMAGWDLITVVHSCCVTEWEQWRAGPIRLETLFTVQYCSVTWCVGNKQSSVSRSDVPSSAGFRHCGRTLVLDKVIPIYYSTKQLNLIKK